MPLSLGLLNNKLQVAGLLSALSPQKKLCCCHWAGWCRGKQWNSSKLGPPRVVTLLNGYLGLCFYVFLGKKNYGLLTRTIASNSTDQKSPNNKCMWKNRANLKIILRSFFLAVSSGLWVRASHSKSTISCEIMSRTFEKFLRQLSSNKVSQCQ